MFCKLFCINDGDQRLFFHFEIIINVLGSSFLFVWIPIVWVYGHYIYVHSFNAVIAFRRQNLTIKVDPRAVSVNPLTAGAANIRVFIFYYARHNFKWVKIQIE